MKQQKRSQVVRRSLTGAGRPVLSPLLIKKFYCPEVTSEKVTESLLHFNSNILLENVTAMANRGQLG